MPADHTEACDGGRCPCYVQGQIDVVEAINVMRRLGMSFADVMSVVSCDDEATPEASVGPDRSTS